MKFTKKLNPTNNRKAASKKNQTLSCLQDDNSSNMTIALSRNGSRSLNKNAPVIIEKDSILAEMDVELYDSNHVEELGTQNQSNQTKIQAYTENHKVCAVGKLQKMVPIKTQVNKINKQKQSVQTKSQSLSNNAKKENQSKLSSQKNDPKRFVIK